VVWFTGKEYWDVVICDPPSFAPNKAAVPKAQASYERLFEMTARVTSRCDIGGWCSWYRPIYAFREAHAVRKAQLPA
jgi:23S rRNA G2069 N7-methylase RlmK/C1962 C5-methylase RlmI